MSHRVEHEDTAPALRGRAPQSQPEIGAKFERHVEPWQARTGVEFDSRDVMH